jgi:O-antigen ligase
MMKTLFQIFLFLLPFQTVYLLREPFVGGVKWEYGIVAVYGIDLLLVCILFLISTSWLRSIKYQVLSIKYGGTEILLILLAAWVGVSVFWAPDQILALYFFVKLLLAIGLFFVVRGTEIDMKKVVFVLLVAGVIQSGIGVAQFLYQYSPGSSILGMSAHEASQAGSSVLKIDSGRFLRAYGTFPHPNILGGFLGAILVFCISYYVFCMRYKKSWSTFFEILSLLGGSMIIFLGLILTFSRTAWLGVLLGIIVIGFHAFRQDDSWIRRRFLKIVFALGLASLVFGSILQEQIFLRFDAVTIEREGSVSERMVSLKDAQPLIEENPFVGVGAGNFTAAVMKGDGRGIMGEMGRPVWSIQPAHNVFVLIFSELGIVGFLMFVGFLASLLFSIPKSAIYNLQSVILITILPSLFLDHFLWTSHFGLLFFFLLLGLASRR